MINKHLLRPERLRRIPSSFSWVDHRLVRQDYLVRADPGAWTLYLFLVTVADAQGLSYYSDAALVHCLSMSAARLSQARGDLVRGGLIAYQRPLYQVLALDSPLVGQTGALSADEIGARIGQLRAALRRTP